MTPKAFKKTIWAYYKTHKRNLPWRKTKDPYKILVSEIMLQQTQVSRVEVKYKSFLKKFPSVETLAKANLQNVLKEWQGLGYNRRALFLKRATEVVVKNFGSRFPHDFKTLCSLPGIGPATAGDIMAFAWNIPVPLIETNIRSVFIHFFFKDKKNIHDKDILPLIEKTLDQENPREWYWALFDYGAFLKQNGNPNRRSKHYIKQSAFTDSTRQKRARILRVILTKPSTIKDIVTTLSLDGQEVESITKNLEKEGFIKNLKGSFYITK